MGFKQMYQTFAHSFKSHGLCRLYKNISYRRMFKKIATLSKFLKLLTKDMVS